MKNVQFKELRERSGLSQADMAKILAIKDKSTISKWETGSSMPRASTIKRLAEMLGVTSDEIIDSMSLTRE